MSKDLKIIKGWEDEDKLDDFSACLTIGEVVNILTEQSKLSYQQGREDERSKIKKEMDDLLYWSDDPPTYRVDEVDEILNYPEK